MSTNPYYQTTGNPGAATRGQSANIRAEYSLVQSGFDAVFQALSTHGLVPPGMPTRTITTSGPIALGDYSYALDVTAAGVTLTPDATTVQSYFWCIVNAVGVDVTVSAAFNDGGVAKKVPAGTSLMLSCNGSTFRAAALAQSAPSFGTLGTATVVNAAASGCLGIAAMTSTAAFVLYQIGSTYKAALVDNTGAILSTATVFGSSGSGSTAQIIPIDTNRCLAVWVDNGSGTRAVQISFSGTTITVGTVLTVDAITTTGAPSVCLLSTTTAAIVWRPNTGSTMSVAALTIPAGPVATTLTLGTGATLFTGSSATTISARICALNATQVYASLLDTGGSAQDTVVTFSGTTVSAVPAAASLTYGTAPAAVDAVPLGQTNRALSLVAFGTSGATPFVSVVEASGTAGSAVCTHGPMVGLPLMYAGAKAIRLQKVSANTYIYMAMSIDGRTSLMVGTIFVRDSGVMVNPPATVLGRTTANPANAALDLTVMGSTLMVAYIDGANSSFPTIRPIPLGGVA